MRQRHWILLLAVCTVLALALAPATAQTRLFPGVSIQGRIASDTPSVEYSFDALAGDRIRARVLGIHGLDATLAILDANGDVMAAGNADPWSPDPTDGFVAFTVPADGPYSVLIGSEFGSSGDSLLQFEQDSAVEPLTLGFGQTTIVPVAQQDSSLWLDFEADPDCQTTMVVYPMVDSSEAYFGYLINVFDDSGAQVGQINGERPVENRLEFAAGSGRYWAQIQPWKSQRDGQ
ncbi:MAG: PPC domain-containing protein, partial [Anaerolineae bacterium]|nr:PPC domain-containing protein [Anaerolineae bacterium]